MRDEAFYRDVIGALRRSAQLEKRAAAGDLTALRTKAAHDLATLDQLKEALDLAPLQRGLLFGSAATVPAVAGGAYLLHKAHQEREQATEDIRNKALQVALGVGGIGAGLMGMHHALSSGGNRPAPAPTTSAPATPAPTAPTAPTAPYASLSPGGMPSEMMNDTGLSPEDLYALQSLSPEELQLLFKQGSVDRTHTVEKLAVVGYLDVVLADAETKTADAHELRLLNAEHGVQLLRELLEVA
jgi:hypothetical protein